MGLAVMGAGMPADGSMVYLSPAPLYHAARSAGAPPSGLAARSW